MFNVSSFPVIDLTRYSKRLLVLPNFVWKRPSGAFFSLRCLIYKVHAVSGGTFAILTSFISFVKYFFQSFLTFAIQMSAVATLLGYHIFSSLSSTFLKFFQNSVFFNSRAASSATAWLEYHAFLLLSTPFFNFLSHFLIFVISSANGSYLYYTIPIQHLSFTCF